MPESLFNKVASLRPKTYEDRDSGTGFFSYEIFMKPFL